MAAIVIHEKGFKCIELTADEAIEVGWGTICDNCNNMFHNDDKLYYVSVLHDILCETCYRDFVETSTYYEEDSAIENDYFEYAKNLFGL